MNIPRTFLQNSYKRALYHWACLLFLTILGSFTYALLRLGGYSENDGLLWVTVSTVSGLIPGFFAGTSLYSAHLSLFSRLVFVPSVSISATAVGTSPEVRTVVSQVLAHIATGTNANPTLVLLLTILVVLVIAVAVRWQVLQPIGLNRLLESKNVFIRVYDSQRRLLISRRAKHRNILNIYMVSHEVIEIRFLRPFSRKLLTYQVSDKNGYIVHGTLHITPWHTQSSPLLLFLDFYIVIAANEPQEFDYFGYDEVSDYIDPFQ